MNKKTQIIPIIILVVIFLFLIIFNIKIPKGDLIVENNKASNSQNATYLIDGSKVTLVNGRSETSASSDTNSLSKTVTRYFGNKVVHDLNGDDRPDEAFILTQENGGSGTFYYFVAAINTPNGYIGSQGLLLGDRIAPQSTVMGKGNVIVVNYADRKPTESFATQPSQGKSLWLLLDPKTMQFGEVAQDFEGEANPASMTLAMKKWNWVETTYNDGAKVSPRATNRFALTFDKNGTFSATTDCNGVGGQYSVEGNQITFEKMMSTLMFCEDSQESVFSKMIGNVQNYHFTTKGELVLGLKYDSGSMIFR